MKFCTEVVFVVLCEIGAEKLTSGGHLEFQNGRHAIILASISQLLRLIEI